MTRPTTARSERWLRGPLRPLRVGQYRLLGGSVLLEMAAAGVWLIAMVWQIVALGGGASELSLVATAAAFGMVATTLVGGVAADRVSQRRILIVVAAVRSLCVGVVAALALGDVLAVWHLAVVGLVVGLCNGFTYPAYSALLPSVVPAADLMAANGLEGTVRPTVMQAGGPAAASAIIAASSPGAAIAVVALLEVAGLVCLIAMRPTTLRRDLDGSRASVRGALGDLRDGFSYMLRTPWLLATLLFASMMVLLMMGPIEVLLPFVIKDRAGGGPGDHALVMASFGAGSALGSLVMAARRMPRRYLTVMNLMWGFGGIPLIVVGYSTHVGVIAATVFVVGVLFSAPMVIWGTLLQRRVPPELLGRVASLDFFVSLVFMPVSMAVAGPLSNAIGLGPVFLLAGLGPVVLAVAAILLARLPQDELAHPLDRPAAGEQAADDAREAPAYQ